MCVYVCVCVCMCVCVCVRVCDGICAHAHAYLHTLYISVCFPKCILLKFLDLWMTVHFIAVNDVHGVRSHVSSCSYST